MERETRYAKSGDTHIAYQITGDGPLDLVFVMGWISHLDHLWEGPGAHFLGRLAGFSRLIVFDKRGTGLSDRVAALPSMEQRMDDVRAVMDAAGSERAALLGISEGAAMCSMFAATYPKRTAALVLYGAYACRLWHPDYPWAPTADERQAFFDAIEQGWGGVVDLDTLAPSTIGDEGFRKWWATYLQRSASPGAAAIAARVGDRHWREIANAHDVAVRRCLLQARGQEVERGVAGFVASFDGPARAIRCAGAIIEATSELGIDVRAGLHTGECEVIDGKLDGVAVQIATRVVARADQGGIAVSSTVKDLVAGSSIAFERIDGRLRTGTPNGLDIYRVIQEPESVGELDPESPRPAGPLSPREREVAVLIGRGLTNRAIADELSISIATVERHAANIYTKLGVHSRTQVAVWAAEQGLLPATDR